jgi:hypothetical protein
MYRAREARGWYIPNVMRRFEYSDYRTVFYVYNYVLDVVFIFHESTDLNLSHVKIELFRIVQGSI